MKFLGIINILLLLLLINLSLTLNQNNASSTTNEEAVTNPDLSSDMVNKILQEFEAESKEPNQSNQLTAVELSSKNMAVKKKKGKKSKKPKPPPKYKVVKSVNKLLKKIKPKVLKKTIFYKPCVIKSGYLNIVQKRPNPPRNLKIKVMPIYVKLTNTVFNLYRSPAIKKPLSSIPLNTILRIDQHYYNTNCLDIITNRVDKKKHKLKEGILTLCADSFSLKKEWILKILDFKRCKLTGRNNVDQNKLIIMDFNNMNIVEKKHDLRHYALSHLYYNGNDGPFKRIIKQITHKREIRKFTGMKSAFHQINLNIKRGNLAAQQIRRKLVAKLNKARSFSKGVSQRTALLRRKYESKMLKEREIEALKINKKNKKKEFKMINKAMSKIQHYKEAEVKTLITSFKSQIRMEKHRAQTEAKNIMRIISEEQKLTNFSVCFSKELKEFKNRKFIQSLCKRYYGEFARNTCETKTSFCQMCCEFHIGIKFPSKRLHCRKKCGKVIKPKSKKNKLNKNKKNNKGKKKATIRKK